MLPPETEKVWNSVKDQPALAGFILIGDSALALRLNHRISEDLDLVYCGEKLPVRRLEKLVQSESLHHLSFNRNDNAAAVEEFLLGGMNLHDFQQDFLVNGQVKISFFTGDSALCRLLSATRDSGVAVASLPELFAAKCLVSALRSRTRDWFDLYWLLNNGHFGWKEYLNSFRRASAESQIATSLTRLCSGVPDKADEGYHHLLKDAPTVQEMTAFFRRFRDGIERCLASEGLKRARE